MKKYHVTTFGCQMNEHDSERMKGMLESLGYEEAPERDGSDLILFNTCSIRESADNRFIAHLGEAKRLKSEQDDVVIGVQTAMALLVAVAVRGLPQPGRPQAAAVPEAVPEAEFVAAA